eukprot:TRINITY_DN75846_c0_g1_i1.p1 TRINITY_DN75846_c0_g1~~TRINITY_DN75846_c0_g1_i1.p1  ORF type:complete len:570 (-),score=43.14 TRINITY_DN75846_c0_g1_i1:79-1788(-)
MSFACSFQPLSASNHVDNDDQEMYDGALLHEQIPPEKWCVTKADLLHFGALVKEAIKDGSIVPTDRDPFDPTDHKVGPNVFTVNEQLIKPLTARAGNASYALMRHPQGLTCDLFVTHCWKEGIFRFIDKVLCSWPPEAHSAYCCMLSNPQNLNIASLISEPLKSPFAAALRSSKYMLVVPNLKISIYTRIWCTYEAFLAYSWGKHIYTAQLPFDGPILLRYTVKMLLIFLLCGLIPVLVEQNLIPISGDDLSAVMGTGSEMIGFMLTILAAFAPSTYPRTILLVNLSAAACLGFMFGSTIAQRHHFWLDPNILPPTANAVMVLMGMVVLVACEADRIIERELKLEASELIFGYTGRVRNAEASSSKDRETILGEIDESGLEGDVDHAISVLISTGMSTPSLRDASKLTNVDGAGQWSLGAVLMALVMWIVHPFLHVYCDVTCQGYLSFVPFLKMVQGITWTVLFVNASPDGKGIVAAAAMRLAVVPYMLIWNVWVESKLLTGKEEDLIRVHCVPDACGAFALGPIMLSISAIGIVKTARIPWIGPGLVTFLLSGHVSRKPMHVSRHSIS